MAKRYRNTHLRRIGRHGWGFTFKVPSDLVPLVGRERWLKTLGVITLLEAERQAAVLHVQAVAVHEHLKTLDGASKRVLVDAGGWCKAPTALALDQQMSTFLASLSEFVDDIPADPDLPAGMRLEHYETRDNLRTTARSATAGATLLTRALTVTPTAPDGLMSLFESWDRAKVRKQASRDRNRRAILALINTVGDRPARLLTRRHIETFREYVEAKYSNQNAARSFWSNFRAVLAHAERDELITSNPAAKVNLRLAPQHVRDDERQPFSDDDVEIIFANLTGTTPDFKLCVRLCTATGARSGELAQFRCQDVVEVVNVDGEIARVRHLDDIEAAIAKRLLPWARSPRTKRFCALYVSRDRR